MTPDRFAELTSRYASLRITVIGDICLDRYLDIDPTLAETSIETGLPVHNVTRIRSQPGGAGTILANLSALGVGTIRAIGWHGRDGEGMELARAVRSIPRVHADTFLETTDRHTFTYTKPLLHSPGQAPRELSRLDIKNWTPTPAATRARIERALLHTSSSSDAIIALDQAHTPDTGVITENIRTTLGEIARTRASIPILADSRSGLRGWPPLIFKMNHHELATLTARTLPGIPAITAAAYDLARSTRRQVFITLAENGILGVDPGQPGPGDDLIAHRIPALPLRGEIDIVGAGDAVSASLITALAAGATAAEAIELANAAASVVIHKLGTTGTATIEEIAPLLK